MKYGTFCSGIGAPELAFNRLGWDAQFCSEIEPFPCAVLQHYYPDVPNMGDMMKIKEEDIDKFRGAIDVVCAGTPCQSFSIQGLRSGLEDYRGGLSLRYFALAHTLKSKWLIWENVVGVLSQNGGRDFASILGTLEKLGFQWAYRVLDAKFFGVPQSRRRVFVVGYSGGCGNGAAQVLFNNKSTEGHLEKSKEAEKTDQTETESSYGKGYFGIPGKAKCLMCQAFKGDPELENFMQTKTKVRRLMPVEWERLQGFPDNFTAIQYRDKPAKDTPRYKAIGNSMAVPVLEWIGRRIDIVNKAEETG